jgi:hypothetical protein
MASARENLNFEVEAVRVPGGVVIKGTSCDEGSLDSLFHFQFRRAYFSI